jgi:hypothetical protein
MEKQYIDFIADLKRNIIQSRYIAARLANKEQLMLYFQTGKMLAEKIASEEWGANVLEQIANDLQKQLPGLRGFSHRNLLNMKRFYTEYQHLIFSQLPTAKSFWGITFTHHILLLKNAIHWTNASSTWTKPRLNIGQSPSSNTTSNQTFSISKANSPITSTKPYPH